MLHIERVTKNFPEKKALDSLSFSVRQGETFALLGHSGCGKSTILRIIAGLETMDSGDVVLGLGSISKLPPHKRGISMMFQNYALLPHLSVAKNITLDGRYDRRTLDEILEKMRISELAKRYPSELSGGQRQRVALARALICNPKVILLDEPFSNVDPSLKNGLRGELASVVKNFGTTAIIVTHDRDDAFCLADRGAIMRDGRAVQTGSIKELYSLPTDRYCAEFFGDINEVDQKTAQLLGLDGFAGEPVFIRPNKITVSDSGIAAVILKSKYFGDFFEYLIGCGGITLKMHTSRHFEIGDEVSVRAES